VVYGRLCGKQKERKKRRVFVKKVFVGLVALVAMVALVIGAIGLSDARNCRQDWNDAKVGIGNQLQSLADNVTDLQSHGINVDATLKNLNDAIANINNLTIPELNTKVLTLTAQVNQLEAWYAFKYDGKYDQSTDLVSQEDIDAMLASITDITCRYHIKDVYKNVFTGEVISEWESTAYMSGTGIFLGDDRILTAGHLFLEGTKEFPDEFDLGYVTEETYTLESAFLFDNTGAKVILTKVFSSYDDGKADFAIARLPASFVAPKPKFVLGKSSELDYGDSLYQAGISYLFVVPSHIYGDGEEDSVFYEDNDFKNNHPYLLDGIVGLPSFDGVINTLKMPWNLGDLSGSTSEASNGYSGGPVFALRDGKLELVGITSGGFIYTPREGFTTGIDKIMAAAKAAGITITLFS
jgi:hypothetical protein